MSTPNTSNPPQSKHKGPTSSRSTSSQSHSRSSMQKTEVKISVYDLLPPSRLSNILWTFGTSLLHSGVVIQNREYAYGGHDEPSATGVYYTRPGQLPPGGTHRLTFTHGYTFLSSDEISEAVKEASQRFTGRGYNLLSRNCNHFTSYLVERLTGRPAPGWLNRAASIGLALPCVVPREWIAPPDVETQDGAELVGEEEGDERTAMLSRQDSDHLRARVEDVEGHEHEHGDGVGRSGNGKLRDTSGREIPRSDRAPAPTART